MENASKALIMAGSVMLAILVIALLIFAWSKFSDFYSSQDELRYTEDIAKFNEQFAAYDRKKVSGYELVTLANKIEDYNFRFSNAEEAKNNTNGNPIEMKIDFINLDNINSLSLDSETADNSNYWFFSRSKTFVTTNGNETKNIMKLFDDAREIELIFNNNPEMTARIAKAIDKIDLDKAAQTYYGKTSLNLTSSERDWLEKICVKNYNSIAGTTFTTYAQVKTAIGSTAKIYQYYEYYRFKLQKFECSAFNYDDQGRVNFIEFKIVK